MKIVLIEDVKSLGRKGEVVEVSEGYARNFLIPKKKGIEANAQNLNTLKLQKANAQKIAQNQLDLAKETAGKIEGGKIEIMIKGGRDGKTYGSVTTKEISQAIKDQFKVDIDKKKIVLAEPIKTFGSHEVTIRLHKDVNAKFTVKVLEA
ncbi:50S ribosomal protein L9 [Johnsonella ignava]|uniref:50S ribosomal protein L9 n=1 Tax=Johnsonella ignava TaxID=43995 RepID=UPI0023F085F9|nr:50S ribosomal protein L9 [Johnsonella ignava]